MVENLLDKYDNIYIIEKNVKIPSAAKPKNTKYPFYKMDVQDSFIVPKTESNCIRSASSLYGKAHSKKFIVRTMGDVVRVWRTI